MLQHFEKHGSEFGAKTPEEYLATGRDIIKNGIKVEYEYPKGSGLMRTGYVANMGATTGKSLTPPIPGMRQPGAAKFGLVGADANGNITTIHTQSGKDFWKMLNNSKTDNVIRPKP